MSFLLFLAWILIVILLARWVFKPKADRRPPSTTTPPPIENKPKIAAPATLAELADAESKLKASDRDTVTAGALQLALRRADRAALLLIRKGFVEGFMGAGDGLDGKTIGSIMIPVSGESILAHPISTGSYWCGRPDGSRLNEALLRGLQRKGSGDVALFPLKIDQRVIALLYADRGNADFDTGTLLALGKLADTTAEAFKRIIMARKPGTSTGDMERSPASS